MSITEEKITNLVNVLHWLDNGLGPGAEDYTDQFRKEYDEAWDFIYELKEYIK